MPDGSTPTDPTGQDPDAHLLRVIGLGGAILLVIGNVIGSGIFLTTGLMAEQVPSISLVLLAWALGGVLAITGGLTYAEMGSMYPQSGGLYLFLTEAYGPLWGFLFGWTLLLVIGCGSAAAIAVGFAEYFSYFVPAFGTDRIALRVPVPWGSVVISAGQVVGAVSIVILGAINYVGVRTANAVQASLTVMKIAALAAIPLLALVFHPVSPAFTPMVPPVPRVAASFGVAMIAVMWTYEGWYWVAFAAGEIKNARRNVPLALVLGTAALTAIYVAVNLAYAYALTIDDMRGVSRIAERAVSAMIGPRGAALVAASVAISTFGCNAAAVLGLSRVGYAMASRGMFFPSAAYVHPRFRTPTVALAMTCGWSVFLTLSGTYEQLFTYVTFASVLFFVAGGIAIFRLRQIKPHVPRGYRTWGYPVVPAMFVLGSSALVINTLMERPRESIAGLGLVALGIPVYRYWRSRSADL